MDTGENKTPFQQPAKASYSDKLFLLNFVMSTYLGPDVFSDNPRCSSFQRLAKRSPPYTSNNLGTSFLSVSQLESLYYYVLRNANPDLVLEPNMLHMYLKGSLHLPSSVPIEEGRQFTSFFPLSLHEHKKYSLNYEIVKGIVLIDNPSTSYVKKEELERFKYLSGIDDLRIDAKECLSFQHGNQNGKTGKISNRSENSSARFGKIHRRRLCSFPNPIPELENCGQEKSIILTGAARNRMDGSQVHLVGIGISEDAYFFQVALPGVRRDFCEFSCDIKSNGEVQIRGTISGGKTIRKRSRVFHMKFQQLCPAGPFAFSFNLPGRVDPRLFSPIFRNDGIFEGVVIKHNLPNSASLPLMLLIGAIFLPLYLQN